MIAIVRGDATMQKLNLMLILHEKKTTIESVWLSFYESQLLFKKKMSMSCLTKKLKIHI